MVNHRRSTLTTRLAALLDGIQENIIHHRVYDFLSRCSVEAMGFLLNQDLAIITLYPLDNFSCCVITRLETEEHLLSYICLFSYPGLTWRVILLAPYTALLIQLLAYMGPSSISPGGSSGPLAISWILWQQSLPWETTYSFLVSR